MAAKRTDLGEYQRKRDFKKTAEPKAKRVKSKGALRFVIQKHDASRLHYDLRLELDGVLKSWAVPKGVPTEKGQKNLAVHVEDHPLDYAEFEGIIPKGQYGGGTVMVWDIGTWEGLGSDRPAKDLDEGMLHFALHGKKLEGEWALIHIKRGESGNEWLLLKSGESIRAISKKKDDESILTGRTMKQIAGAADAVWESGKKGRRSGNQEIRKGARKAEEARPSSAPSGLGELPRESPAFIEPMMAKLVDAPPPGKGWVFELKFDGYRALAIRRGNDFELLSRNKKSFTTKFSDVFDALDRIAADEFVIDGEICALDSEGRPSFQLLQAFEQHEEQPPVWFYAFDLLNLNGHNVRSLGLGERKELLQSILPFGDPVLHFSANIEGNPKALLEQIRARGLEGIIGKRAGGAYEAGRRSGAWVKLKTTKEQEFVIGGFTAPQGARKFFGALLVGYYEDDELLFAAKVGTGFSEKLLRELHMRFMKVRIAECPFANLPTTRAGRWSEGITRAEMKLCTWIEPKLVAQVRFTEWTRDGGLRHPAFLGLREDKDAGKVVRETAGE